MIQLHKQNGQRVSPDSSTHKVVVVATAAAVVVAIVVIVFLGGGATAPSAQGLLIHEVSRSHTTTYHSQ